MPRSGIRWIILMHALFLLYSAGSICSKLAAGAPFMSVKFVLLYSFVIIILACYAIGWQQVIKHVPLSTAYANKSITIAWGILWGLVFFQERITLGKMIGALIVIAGVVLFTGADHDTFC